MNSLVALHFHFSSNSQSRFVEILPDLTRLQQSKRKTSVSYSSKLLLNIKKNTYLRSESSFEDMFPLGIVPYIVGGILIGVGVGHIYIATGLHATQSSFFSTTLSYFSKRPYFQQKQYLNSRGWRLTFAVGVILGALVYTLTLSPEGFFTTSVQWWRLALGGFLVGFGTRLSKGCTSGHGISGLGSLSTTSLYAVITFLVVGILTAMIVQALGVIP